jgi:predicted nucleotidyltransferase
MENLTDSEFIKNLNVKEEQQINILKKLSGNEFKNYISKFSVSSVLIFGSAITEEFNEESDVDIAVLGKSKVDIKGILQLELFLEDLLERNIDVVDLRSENLDIFIKINILNNSQIIYSTDNNKILEELKEEIDWYYRENEHYFECRRRDLLS